ncbi:bifunctional riboflavin kinase/FAD synthetase [Micromonospora ureilytica]|uniref:Riboflavin biosynthesis protein n=1 Tax=Micromonospora ureilytica TaxID=709868 RepID=A0A3N9Y285_9ACTN|nr:MULTISPECIES: bifunctional riboflavin kinase/FAD synthetase [Micromonospora]MBQ1016299.1 bifunctional riboflavin kinase/FAD synthetase [Micromonospora sp. D93]RQX19042.1 bifunctional riboflavin kinase/FAD synthetase [Micromonospora ureilytica]
MQRWRGYDAAPGGWGRSVVTIGVFDGVHKGHQATIGHTVARARELGVQSVVVTFDPHPAEVVRPGSHPAVLTEPARKAELIEALGVDVLCVVPFTPEFSRVPAEQFVHDVLVEHLHAALVVVGNNFRFGHRAAGDVALLERLGQTFGFGVEGNPLVAESGTVFSSTYIRSCVDAGDVGAAAAALGRPHRVEGVVVRGDQRGRELGFPTANLLCHRYAAVPADGVYAARLIRRGQHEPLLAAVSVGTNPTFSGRERRVEAYALDFSGDLYGERLALDFVAHLRGQIRYDSIEPLIAQMNQDVERTRRVLA